MVFSGCKNAPGSHCGGHGGKPYTNVAASPVIAEKPFITENGGRYTLNVPRVERNKVGNSGPNYDNVDKVDFSKVFVANEHNSASDINSKLDQGFHVVLQPGNYRLTDSIRVNKPGQVVLGIGLATLISTTGKSCIEIGDVDGVRVAGVLLDAGQ